MSHFPFSAIVGQEQMKAALVLAAVNPGLGGVLLRGDKGTGKSVASRGLAAVLPRLENGRRPPVVEVPFGVTREELLGRLDAAESRRFGVAALQPGLLARAHEGILFIDRVNLLPEALLEAVMEVQRSGVNRVHDQGEEQHHPCRFLLIAALAPEEGDLRHHFLDRFAVSVMVEGLREPAARTEVLNRCRQHERDPQAFAAYFKAEDQRLAGRILSARESFEDVSYNEEALRLVVSIASSVETPGHRADLALLQAACALSALEELTEIGPPQIQSAASLVLPHRMRSTGPVDEPRLAEAARRDYFTPTG